MLKTRGAVSDEWAIAFAVIIFLVSFAILVWIIIRVDRHMKEERARHSSVLLESMRRERMDGET